MAKPKLIVFASGTKVGGGSGFENLVAASKRGELDVEIVGVVSNHENGGVAERAKRLQIPFIYFDPSTGHSNILKNMRMSYGDVVSHVGAEWVALSGWLKQVQGLDPAKTFNIHPAILSYDHGRFGGSGLYGHHVHEAVKNALDSGAVTGSGCSMHFVTDEYDRGPVFFEYHVQLEKGASVDDIAKAVMKVEHEWQPKITNMVVHGEIRWDGKDPKSLTVPKDFKYFPKQRNPLE